MKKIKKKYLKKKSIKRIPTKKKPTKRKPAKKIPIKRKPAKKIPTKRKPAKKIPTKRKPAKKKPFKRISIKKKESLILKIIRLQYFLRPKFNIKINFSLEKYIQLFFDKIANAILDYKILKAEDKRKRKLDEIEKKENERILLQKKKIRGRADTNKA